MIRAALHDCALDQMSESSSSNAASSAASSAVSSASGSIDARRHLASSGGVERCVGFGPGFLHALAPFLAMYLIWSLETHHKARFSCASKLHTLLDLCGNLVSPCSTQA